MEGLCTPVAWHDCCPSASFPSVQSDSHDRLGEDTEMKIMLFLTQKQDVKTLADLDLQIMQPKRANIAARKFADSDDARLEELSHEARSRLREGCQVYYSDPVTG
jgi:hypothetical protein